MLNVVNTLLNLIERHTLWLYLACLVVILYYVRVYANARRDRANTIFTIEKEIAIHKEGRAMSAIGMMLGLMVVITALKYYLIPTLDVSALVTPTPTMTLPVPTRVPPTATPTATMAPTLTPRSQPTRPPTQVMVTPTNTAALPAPCPNPEIRITRPGMDARVSGRLAIVGTAKHANFQFYKVEIAPGEKPSAWSVVNNIHRQPVENGVLEELDTRALPNGVYWLQLVVVDHTGNFPPPCQVRIVIQN